jgi:hypothetical protein
MAMTEANNVLDMIARALVRRNDARDAWAVRLDSILEPLVRERGELRVGQHYITRERVTATCSQGPGWPRIEASENRLVVDGLWTLGYADLSYHDGHNHQRQRGSVRLGDVSLRPAPVLLLAELAPAIPAVAQSVVTALDAETRVAQAASE